MQYTSHLDNLYERSTLVKEYVTAMKTVKQRHLVDATKEAAVETRKELTPTKKTLTGIDGVLNRGASAPKPQVRVQVRRILSGIWCT